LPFLPDGFIPSTLQFGKTHSEQLTKFIELYLQYASIWKLPQLPPTSSFNAAIDYGKLFRLYKYVVQHGGYFGIRCAKRWSEVNCVVAYNQASRTGVQPYYIKYLLRFEFQHQYVSQTHVPDINWDSGEHAIAEELQLFAREMSTRPSKLQIKQANAYKNFLEHQRKIKKFKKKLIIAQEQDDSSTIDEHTIHDDKSQVHRNFRDNDTAMQVDSTHHHQHQQDQKQQQQHQQQHPQQVQEKAVNYDGMVNRFIMSLSTHTLDDVNWALNTLMHLTHTSTIDFMSRNTADKYMEVDDVTLTNFSQHISKQWYAYTSSILSSLLLDDDIIHDDSRSLNDSDMISLLLRKPMRLSSLINSILSIIYQYYKQQSTSFSTISVQYNEQQFLAALTILHNMTSHHVLCQYISTHGAMLSILFDILREFIDKIQAKKLAFSILSNILCTCRHMQLQRNVLTKLIEHIVQVVDDYNYVLLQRSSLLPSPGTDKSVSSDLRHYDQLYQSSIYTLNVVVSHYIDGKADTRIVLDNHIASTTYTKLLMYACSIKLPVDISILSLQSLLCCYKRSYILQHHLFADESNIKRLVQLLTHRDAEVRRTAASFIANIHDNNSRNRMMKDNRVDMNIEQNHDVRDAVLTALKNFESLLVNACSNDLDVAYYLAPAMRRMNQQEQ
jgi:hypothetical protein